MIGSTTDAYTRYLRESSVAQPFKEPVDFAAEEDWLIVRVQGLPITLDGSDFPVCQMKLSDENGFKKKQRGDAHLMGERYL